MGKYDKYYEMRTPNPVVPGGEEQMFKCTDCGSETFPERGWSGEPDRHVCSHD